MESPAHLCTEDPGGPWWEMHTDDPGREEVQSRGSGNVPWVGGPAIPFEVGLQNAILGDPHSVGHPGMGNRHPLP